jgi:hypothetical protein
VTIQSKQDELLSLLPNWLLCLDMISSWTHGSAINLMSLWVKTAKFDMALTFQGRRWSIEGISGLNEPARSLSVPFQKIPLKSDAESALATSNTIDVASKGAIVSRLTELLDAQFRNCAVGHAYPISMTNGVGHGPWWFLPAETTALAVATAPVTNTSFGQFAHRNLPVPLRSI